MSIKNPAHFERTCGDEGVNDAIKKAKDDGYDGLIVTSPIGGDRDGSYWSDNFVAFHSSQIINVDRISFDELDPIFNGKSYYHEDYIIARDEASNNFYFDAQDENQ